MTTPTPLPSLNTEASRHPNFADAWISLHRDHQAFLDDDPEQAADISPFESWVDSEIEAILEDGVQDAETAYFLGDLMLVSRHLLEVSMGGDA